MNLKAEFISQLEKSYEGLKAQPLSPLISENLISPFHIELPADILKQARDIVAAAFSLREKSAYIQHYQNELRKAGIQDPGNKSVVMSYDFHINEDNELKLIEINTNAAFLLLGYEMYEMRSLPVPVRDFSRDEIRRMILRELALQNKNIPEPSVVITDEDPSGQRLYIEFLAYNELFKSFGWRSDIRDVRDVFSGARPDFIYNRSTDFLLREPQSAALREKFLNRDVCLSPNPFEYLLLADKQRLIDWCAPGFLESMDLSTAETAALKRMLPLSYDVTLEAREELWAQRKKLFFKPKRAFGSKQSYRGASISRKHFDDFCGAEMIAQEYVAAPEKAFSTPDGEQNYKYDLRCYAYQGRLQMIVARLYQGQVTNLRTPGGGFACVLFN
jgi:hypothetical protein